MAPDPLTLVRQRAKQYQAAQARRDQALELLRDAIVQADQEGATRHHIVEASGLARQTVYDALQR